MKELTRPRSLSRDDLLEWLSNYEKALEEKAEKRLLQNKYLMYGYLKAVAVHIRHLKRQLKRTAEEFNIK